MKPVEIDMERACQLAEEGKSMLQVAALLGVAPRTFYDRASASAEYARAEKIGFERDLDELEVVSSDPPKYHNGKVDLGYEAWRRNRVDTLKWRIAKRIRRYMDKLAIGGDPDAPPIKLSVAEREARIAAILARASARQKADGAGGPPAEGLAP